MQNSLTSDDIDRRSPAALIFNALAKSSGRTSVVLRACVISRTVIMSIIRIMTIDTVMNSDI